MDGFSQRALPVTFFPTKPKTIVAGITQEQLQVINQNTIPQPTPFGTEIQFYLPQLGNTFLDCSTAYLLFNINVQFQNVSGGTIYANQANGAVIGSFYSFFQRLTVYANSVNVTDDIWELGLIACYYLKLTMSKQARECMSYLMGFNPDPYASVGLTGYRVKGVFPMSAEGDALAIVSNTNLANNFGYQTGLASANNAFFIQQFHVAIPMIGSLGVNNPNMYYLGLGNTRISLFVDNPTTAFFLPAGMTSQNFRITSAATPPVAASEINNAGGLALTSFNITRARFIGNIIRLDDTVMNQVIQLMQPVNGQQLVTKCTSFGVSTQSLPSQISGTVQVAMNIRRGSVKSVLCLFNNTGALNTASQSSLLPFVTANGTGASIETVNPFSKYGSINPGLGANTLLLINNVNYPKLGLNPTQFPAETFSYILEGLELLTSDDMKPSIIMQNWLVADPAIVLFGALQAVQTQNDTTNRTTSAWRAGTYVNGFQQLNAGLTSLGLYANTQISRSALNAFIPQHWIDAAGGWNNSVDPFGNEPYTSANEFFLYFSLEDQPRPGMISGKNTMDGSNFLNLNIITPTGYAYTVYFIAVYDALLVHDFAERNVYYVS